MQQKDSRVIIVSSIERLRMNRHERKRECEVARRATAKALRPDYFYSVQETQGDTLITYKLGTELVLRHSVVSYHTQNSWESAP